MKELKLLVQTAKQARKNAYAPFSKFRVGAALLTTDNKITLGCNIENASYGLTVCAERVAIFKAVSEGYRKFKAIAIVAQHQTGRPTDRQTNRPITYPCGACLQVMAEFAPNLTVIISNGKNKTKIVKLKELLPKAFRL
ncbi:MAG: cytidine deaminase [Planctomycetes bacterium]|nr:cytidine deaminase [Planctomycetota bacterium]